MADTPTNSNTPNPWETFGANMGRIEQNYKEATTKAREARKAAIKKAKADRDAALKAPAQAEEVKAG